MSEFFFLFFFNLLSPKKSFWDAHPPPTKTVNARPVCILLECILVYHFESLSYDSFPTVTLLGFFFRGGGTSPLHWIFKAYVAVVFRNFVV